MDRANIKSYWHIMTYTLEQINIRRFMLMLFNKQFDDCTNWEELYTQYIDVSGLGKTGQLGLLTAIHNLDVRIGFINEWLRMQRGILILTNEPYYPAFEDLNNAGYGHRAVWTDKEQFEKLLSKIESKEQRISSDHRMLTKELESMQRAEKPGTVDARNQFFILLNVIGKHQGYAINKDDTNMLEFSLMVNSFNEEQRAMEKENEKHGKK